MTWLLIICLSRLSGLSDPVQNLEPPQEVNQGRLDCLQDWTERRLDTVLITLPHRDPYRLLREFFTATWFDILICNIIK